MSRSFVTNMKYFLDENGAIADSISPRARRFLQNLGMIVASVTAQPGADPKPGVLCWNKIKRKQCSGKIDAGIDLRKFDILWHCLSCGDHGVISNWEHTFWDGNYRG